MNKNTDTQSWNIKQLSQICTVVSGGTPSRDVSDYWYPAEVVWVTPTDITRDGQRVLTSSKEKISQKGLINCSAKLLPKNTILMTSRATLGEMKVAGVECCTNQGFKSLIPTQEVDPWFLFYQMKRKKPQYERLGIGSTFLEVNKKDTDSFLIEIPDYSAQKKIAKILTTIDQLIEKTQALIDKHTAIKQGMMADLFTRGIAPTTGQLRPPVEQAPHLYKETELGWVPKEWCVTTFQDLLNNQDVLGIQDGNHGEMHPKSSDFTPEGVPFIMANNIVDNQLDYKNCYFISHQQYNSLRIGFSYPGDILLTHKGTVGLAAIVPEQVKHIMLTPQVTYYRVSEEGVIASKYLYYYFQTPCFQILLQTLSEQTTRKYIGITKQKRLPIFVPSRNEQLSICEKLNEVFLNISNLTLVLEKQTTLKKGLMQDLLTGKVGVDTND